MLNRQGESTTEAGEAWDLERLDEGSRKAACGQFRRVDKRFTTEEAVDSERLCCGRRGAERKGLICCGGEKNKVWGSEISMLSALICDECVGAVSV